VDFKEECFKLREELKPYEKKIRGLMEVNEVRGESNQGEMKANVMLAFRHLEDLRMRLGKAIQAYDGGTSVYPR
jgi:hypothetical protein